MVLRLVCLPFALLAFAVLEGSNVSGVVTPTAELLHSQKMGMDRKALSHERSMMPITSRNLLQHSIVSRARKDGDSSGEDSSDGDSSDSSGSTSPGFDDLKKESSDSMDTQDSSDYKPGYDSSDGRDQDDSSDGGSKSRCRAIGGSVPSGTYAGLQVDDDDDAKLKEFYDQARRYCDDTRIVLLGDSIMNHLRNSASCIRNIYKRYGGKGLNFGVSGIGARTVSKFTRWIFEDTCIAPQAVYLAVGVNDCYGGRTGLAAVQGIIDAIKIIKHFSPDTHVVVQNVLPTTKPYEDADGRRWESQEYYKCVERINREIDEWVEDHRSSCISIADHEDLILDSNGKFRNGVYDDGIHFWREGNMDEYCDAIADAVEPYSGGSVSVRGSWVGWIDTEPFSYELKNEPFHRWVYGDWSACPGKCGVQKRTAKCVLQHPANSTKFEMTNSSFCDNAFTNPLERRCNITDDCAEVWHEDRGPLILQQGSIFQDGEQSGRKLWLHFSVTAAVACAVLIALAVFGLAVFVKSKEVNARQDSSTDSSLAISDAKANLAKKDATQAATEDVQV